MTRMEGAVSPIQRVHKAKGMVEVKAKGIHGVQEGAKGRTMGDGNPRGHLSNGPNQVVTRPQWRFAMPVTRLDGMGDMISGHALTL